jgi:hypothetical protein
MTTSGVVEEGSLPTEPRPEPTDRTLLGKILFKLDGIMESRSRKDGTRGPDPDCPPPPLTEADIISLIREHGGGHVSWGNQYPPPHKDKRDPMVMAIGEAIRALMILALGGVFGFIFGRLWDHETRISHIEGREKVEVPHVGSP